MQEDQQKGVKHYQIIRARLFHSYQPILKAVDPRQRAAPTLPLPLEIITCPRNTSWEESADWRIPAMHQFCDSIWCQTLMAIFFVVIVCWRIILVQQRLPLVSKGFMRANKNFEWILGIILSASTSKIARATNSSWHFRPKKELCCCSSQNGKSSLQEERVFLLQKAPFLISSIIIVWRII